MVRNRGEFVNRRNNLILIGIILLLVGVVSVMQGLFHFHYRDITVTAAGLAFLLLKNPREVVVQEQKRLVRKGVNI